MRFYRLTQLVLTVAALASPLSVHAATLDQGQIYDTDGRVILYEDLLFGQTITAGISGDLVGLDVLYEEGVAAPIQFSLYSGTSPSTGDLLFSERIVAPEFLDDEESPFVFRWDLTGRDLYFDAGTTFVFAFMAETSGVEWSASDPPDYLGGALSVYIGGLPFRIDGAGDLAFRTHVERLAPVPVPHSGALFAGALLLGLGASARRRLRG